MAEKLTEQQLQAITDRGGMLLVSAAAGSGKTKVLVDRLLSYLTDPIDPANLDDFLIITYTKAAAAELRSKIAAKLSERIAEQPTNRHLQQQMQRLYLTKISTVHAFCGDILREYAYKLDIPADFRVADENECLELQIRAMQKVLDNAYEHAGEDPDFRAFIDSQGFGRDDRQIPEILLKVYQSAQCHLDPDKWLDWCVSAGDVSGADDVSDLVWGRYLLEDLRNYLQLQIRALEDCAQLAVKTSGMEKPASLLFETAAQLRVLSDCKKWDDVQKYMNIDYGRMVFSKQCADTELAEKIKVVRDACKRGVAKRLRRFTDDSSQVLADLSSAMAATRGLVQLTKEFASEYGKHKRSRRILDFSDLEHQTLDLLLGKNRLGATQTATEIGQRFREVMVDEYQDSNAVQDAIFSALTKQRNNCFMVGDVKQSIYQFRLADPSIFLEKYNSFVPAGEAAEGQGRKVLLSSNFRSAGNVIKAVNDVFTTCMSPQVGGLTYGEDELLKEGIPHQKLDEAEIELFGIDVQENTYTEEASFVADKIEELLDGSHLIREKDRLRPIEPDDIVILLRSPGSVGGEFQYALEQRGISCCTGTGADLLQAEEIQVLRALLQVISNPIQDIPLIAVLSSRVFGFTANDLAQMIGDHRSSDIYSSLVSSNHPKALHFLNMLSQMRWMARMNSLSRLLPDVLALTKLDSIYASLCDGAVRVENVQTFCKLASEFEANGSRTLDQFLEHLDALDVKGIPATGEQSNIGSVTIMSIHKSKGLEFPVVFLCGLSREFNRESARAQVLCDKELGLGLACVNAEQRVRYPTVSKRAIAAKIMAESLSEEMRVLYVAMTRAKDRLIMTYAAKDVEEELCQLKMRMDFGDLLLLTGDANCPGQWVLMPALKNLSDDWNVQIVTGDSFGAMVDTDQEIRAEFNPSMLYRMKDSLSYRYPHLAATQAPSKQTATQLKGRDKDREAAQNANEDATRPRSWRKPTFVQEEFQQNAYGTAIHAVMQHICFAACTDYDGVKREINRLAEEGFISKEQGEIVSVEQVANFFATDLGSAIRKGSKVLREFKFSILDDASSYYSDVFEEKILLQGVVDCALIEDDGITVLDFKSDRVTEETASRAVENYRGQIEIYANALSRIYQKPIKSAQLYFFNLNKFIAIL